MTLGRLICMISRFQFDFKFTGNSSGYLSAMGYVWLLATCKCLALAGSDGVKWVEIFRPG